MKEDTLEELIEGLIKACELFDRIQEKKAVLEAKDIIRGLNDHNTKAG